MELFPDMRLTWLNGFLCILPLLALRYLLPAIIRRGAGEKLLFFPPVRGRVERAALGMYYPAALFLLSSPLLFPLQVSSPFFEGAAAIYIAGLFFLLCSIVSFSVERGFTYRGIYRVSRNPMYIGYFLVFLGIALAIGSGIHLAVILIYQVAVHFLVLSEERWCRHTFGSSYEAYCRRVPRYLLRSGIPPS